MGSSLCKPHTKRRVINSSSWIGNENDNPFETAFTKKERQCLRESYQRLNDPKELIGVIFVDIVADLCPDFKKVFGVDRAPKVSMLKMPKCGGHVARMAEFFEQITLMIGYTENLVGALQLARKTGRLHAKVDFLEENQNQQLGKDYFGMVNDYFIERFIPYLTGTEVFIVCHPEGGNIHLESEAFQKDPCEAPGKSTEADERRRMRFAQNYSVPFITETWRRFFAVLTAQLTESFEFERHKCLKKDNQKTLAPHQQAEEDERKRRLNAERQSEMENTASTYVERKQEELFEDPF